MNRTERLLNLLQVLRTYRYPVSGQRLAEKLKISIRTLYRDIATLQSQGAEIVGEPGIGYILRPGFFMPPLMFTAGEIDALLLGMQWVSQYGDAPLAKSATDAVSKITDVLPASVRNNMSSSTLRVGPPMSSELAGENLSYLREAIRTQRKIRITYRSGKGKRNSEIIWPFTIGYFVEGRILVGWSENRKEFRYFKTMGILDLEDLGERYAISKDELFGRWRSVQMQSVR